MRGKHARSAAVRRDTAETETTIATYQRKCRDLAAEVKAEKEARLQAAEQFAKDIRVLKAQVAETTSPRVMALEAELRRLRDRVQAVESEKVQRQKSWDRMLEQIGGTLIEIGLVRTQFEALQVAVGATTETAGGQVSRWRKLGLSLEQQEALRAAQSHHRTYRQIIEDWNRRVDA